VYGQDTPREFRNGNTIAADIYVGFEGAPGHEAGPLVGARAARTAATRRMAASTR
jgi:hypothetical protein